MISACMLFDSTYSIEGWLSYKRIRELDPSIKVYILCLDTRVFYESRYWQKYNGNIIPIQLYNFENHFQDLLKIRSSRPWNAYTQTCKVFLPSYIFEKYNEDSVYYIDSDVYFWENSTKIEEILNCSFLVSSREQNPPPTQGRFNGGFFACKNDKESKKFLKWWQEKTIDWCLWKAGPNGRFGEEGYLNIIYDDPDRFSNILVCSHSGINLAYWNMYKHNLLLSNNKIIIDDKYPLVCFHYQGMKIYKDYYESGIELKNNVVKYIYDLYFKEYISFKEEFLNVLDPYRWR